MSKESKPKRTAKTVPALKEKPIVLQPRDNVLAIVGKVDPIRMVQGALRVVQQVVMAWRAGDKSATAWILESDCSAVFGFASRTIQRAKPQLSALGYTCGETRNRSTNVKLFHVVPKGWSDTPHEPRPELLKLLGLKQL